MVLVFSYIFTTKRRSSRKNSLERTRAFQTSGMRMNSQFKTIRSPLSPNKMKKKTIKIIRQSIKHIRTLQTKIFESKDDIMEVISYELWQKILNEPMDQADEKNKEEENLEDMFDGEKKYFEIRVRKMCYN